VGRERGKPGITKKRPAENNTLSPKGKKKKK